METNDSISERNQENTVPIDRFSKYATLCIWLFITL